MKLRILQELNSSYYDDIVGITACYHFFTFRFKIQNNQGWHAEFFPASYIRSEVHFLASWILNDQLFARIENYDP